MDTYDLDKYNLDEAEAYLAKLADTENITGEVNVIEKAEADQWTEEQIKRTKEELNRLHRVIRELQLTEAAVQKTEYQTSPSEFNDEIKEKLFENPDELRYIVIQYPEFFPISTEHHKKIEAAIQHVDELREQLWSLSPRPTYNEIRKQMQDNLEHNRDNIEGLDRCIRDIYDCKNNGLGESKQTDDIRFNYLGYTEEDFETLFRLIGLEFKRKYATEDHQGRNLIDKTCSELNIR